MALLSPIGLHINGVESALMTVNDAVKSQYNGVWVRAGRVELNEKESAGTVSTGTIPGVNVITSK